MRWEHDLSGPGRPDAPAGGARVSIYTFGCRANQYDSDMMRRALAPTGAGSPHVCVLNACAVTSLAERKARQLARRIRREHPGARIVLIGCLADAVGQGVARFDEADLMAGNAWKSRVSEVVARALAGERGSLGPRRPGPLDGERSGGPARRIRAFLKVQDGCTHACTYCRPTQVRGPARSKSVRAAVDEAAGLIAAGSPEIVLTGINLADYAPPDGSLGQLIRSVLGLPGLQRLRLASINVSGLTDDLLSTFGDPRACPHFHVPLQSGDDAVLRRMGRGETVGAYRAALARTAAAVPGATFGTDIIVGFPGEDETAFARTVAVILGIGFSNLHVFRYSDRPGTPAAGFPDRVPESAKRDRAERLLAEWGAARRRLLDTRLGTTQDVLVEEGSNGRWQGHTSDYFHVTFRSSGGIAIGDIRSVRITRTADDHLEGEDRDRDGAGGDHPAGQRGSDRPARPVQPQSEGDREVVLGSDSRSG